MTAVEIVWGIRQGVIADSPRIVSQGGYFLASAEDEEFGTLFGRDGILCGKFSLWIYKEAPHRLDLLGQIKNTLKILALNQGTAQDGWRDEEEGKILHELRQGNTPKNIEKLGKLGAGNWPVKNGEMKYFGSVDSTPLFVSLAAEYFLATGDWEFFNWLSPYVKKAIDWMEKSGDINGDGYLRFSAKNRSALVNQGWKDSGDSIEIAPKLRPFEPIALVEVQGYAYEAYVQAAQAYLQLGDWEYSKKLYQRAGILVSRLNEDFWMEDEGYYAYAIDGNNKQVRDVTSNALHLIGTGIIPQDRLRRVVDRMMQPDLWTPYGVRPLSTNSHYFSDKEPSAYHNGGGVWPHDNGLIIHGLREQGFHEEAGRLIDGILNAAWILERDFHVRNGELHMVDRNNNLRPYNTAQCPQGWALKTFEYLTEYLDVAV